MTVPIASDSRATSVIVETRPIVRPRRPGANRSAVRAWAGAALAVADTARIVPEVPVRGEPRRGRPEGQYERSIATRASFTAMDPPGTISPTVSAPMSNSASRLTMRVSWLTLSAFAVVRLAGERVDLDDAALVLRRRVELEGPDRPVVELQRLDGERFLEHGVRLERLEELRDQPGGRSPDARCSGAMTRVSSAASVDGSATSVRGAGR